MERNENMDRMDTAISSLAGKDAEQAARDMSFACNTFGLDPKAFVELIKVQKPRIIKIWTDICWHWVERLSRKYEQDRFDDRNKQSCYTGWILHQNTLEQYRPTKLMLPEGFISVYVNFLAYDHNTLQQSFSNLVFGWLDYLAIEKKSRRAKPPVSVMINTRGDYWYRMPMI
jgi:hypothetical protein